MSAPTTSRDEQRPEEQDEQDLEMRETAGLSQGQIVRQRFFRHTGAMVGLVVFVLVLLLAFTSIGFWGWSGWWDKNFSSRYPVITGGAPTLLLPSWLGGSGGLWFVAGEHPFGQDQIGRDIFARVMRGTQTSVVVMIVMGFVATVIGLLMGALSGFFRGKVDPVLMRFTDLIIIFPTIVVGAILGLAFGAANPLPLALALGLLVWPPLARLVRGEFFSLREREFVDAARVAGASNARIIFKHMIPNAMGVIIVNTTLLLSQAILLETTLAYLDFGITEPNVSLGTLISLYESAFSTRPWLFWWPGLFIIVIALCVNFVGDGLRDAFDPRQKKMPSARKMRAAARREVVARQGGGGGAPRGPEAGA
ncbi:ABC transporter permease [Pseudokineococcus sp. 1T1Z-3]|uniref:ABC transporter permease n=1 Tax=Pseudokineococcus sp. 1T1Z-3 TaxID=3132745 RepID=UPI00309C3C20